MKDKRVRIGEFDSYLILAHLRLSVWLDICGILYVGLGLGLFVLFFTIPLSIVNRFIICFAIIMHCRVFFALYLVPVWLWLFGGLPIICTTCNIS